MNPVWGHVIGAITVMLMLTFIGIWIWAWLPSHKRRFDALSRIPMHDEARDSPSQTQWQARS